MGGKGRIRKEKTKIKNAERLKQTGHYLGSTYYAELKGNLLRAKEQYNFADRNAYSVMAFRLTDNPEIANFWAKTSDGKLWYLIQPKLAGSCIASVQDALWALTGLRSHVTRNLWRRRCV